MLLLPHAEEPVPAALLLHGLGSRKERMADTVGDGLMKCGIAALAVDLPLHGERAGTGDDLRSMSPMDLIGSWSEAVAEAQTSLAFLASHPRIDGHRLGVVGYSLGSFLANLVASTQPDVRAIVLAASGDLPEGLPFAPLIRSVIDPLRAVRALAGRPLLMVNGRYDRTVTARQGELLFAAAGEPKVMRWYNGGHWPPAAEIAFACEWLATRLGAGDARTPRTTASTAS